MIEPIDGEQSKKPDQVAVCLDDLKIRIHRLLNALSEEMTVAASSCRRVLEELSSSAPLSLDRRKNTFGLRRLGRGSVPSLETAKTLALIERELARVLSIKKRIPLAAKPNETSTRILPETRHLPQRTGNKILIVDDDPIILRLLNHFLGKSGYLVKSATDGREGLAVAFDERPDLILLDVMMPGMDGFRFLELLRQGEGLGRVPVLMISSMIEEDKVIQALEAGAWDYIVKPFSSRIVLAKIRRALRDLP
jgi:CheY-like chemotaxis protein